MVTALASFLATGGCEAESGSQTTSAFHLPDKIKWKKKPRQATLERHRHATFFYWMVRFDESMQMMMGIQRETLTQIKWERKKMHEIIHQQGE